MAYVFLKLITLETKEDLSIFSEACDYWNPLKILEMGDQVILKV